MSPADEEWVKSALIDDTMVVQLLVQLQNTSPFIKPTAVPLDWSVRQRRSKSVSVNKNQKKTAHQASPTTLLSWGGVTSVSGGSGGTGDGSSEESSEPPSLKLSNTTRSKVHGINENISSKRPRKKTLAQLQEEENFLIKERRELNKDITALQTNLEKQTAKNKSLKRMKIESQSHLDRRAGYSSSQEESVSGNPRPSTMHLIASDNGVTLQYLKQNGNTASEPHKFVLPDLNIPFEDSSSDVICGVS